MKAKEVQQKLNNIDKRLSELGDLSELIQQSQGLPKLINETETKKNEAESFLRDLLSSKEELTHLTKTADDLSSKLNKKDKDVSNLVKQTNELRKRVDDLLEETKVQLGIAANAKLASTFEKMKKDLGDEKKDWFKWLVGAVTLLIVVTSLIIIWQVSEGKTIFELSFLTKIVLTSPIIYFVVFINREYGRVRSLMEEYAFKASIARSFEAYKEIIETIFQKEKGDEFPRKKLDFILSAVKDLYSSPMKNIKDYHVKEKENDPDVLSKIKEIIPDE